MSLAPSRLFCVVAVFAAVSAIGQAIPAGTYADVEERTLPFGKLCLKGEQCGAAEAEAAPAAASAALSGGEVYDRFCHTCHNTGLNEAPKLGDAEAWAPRVAKGMDALLQTTRTGLNLMPMMGLCMACSDAELQAAIDYMIGDAEAEAES